MIKAKIDDLTPPGLIYLLIYLAGDDATYNILYPGDYGALLESYLFLEGDIVYAVINDPSYIALGFLS